MTEELAERIAKCVVSDLIAPGCDNSPVWRAFRTHIVRIIMREAFYYQRDKANEIGVELNAPAGAYSRFSIPEMEK